MKRAAPALIALALCGVTYQGCAAQQARSETEQVEDTYLTYCALCHGLGRGPGPLWDSFKKPAPDLTELARRNGGVYPAERVAAAIRDGGTAGHGTMRLLSWAKYFGRDLGEERADQLIKELTDYLGDRQAR